MSKIYCHFTVTCNDDVHRFYFNTKDKYIVGFCEKHFNKKQFYKNAPDYYLLLPIKIKSKEDFKKYLLML